MSVLGVVSGHSHKDNWFNVIDTRSQTKICCCFWDNCSLEDYVPNNIRAKRKTKLKVKFEPNTRLNNRTHKILSVIIIPFQ